MSGKVGPHTLKLKVVDESDDVGVDLVATVLKVTADYQFINELEMMGLAYKIN